MAFFISISLQFDAYRTYLSAIVDELSDMAKQSRDQTNIQSIFGHIVNVHVAANE